MNETSPGYLGWRVAVGAATGVALSTVVFYLLAVLVRPLAGEFGWRREEISRAYSLLVGAAALTAPVWGRLFDRRAPRHIVAAGLALSGLGLISLSGLGPRLGRLYITFALLGLVVAGTTALAYARTLAGWFDRRRGLAFGLLLGGAAFAGIALPPLLQALVESAGWRTTCVLAGALQLAVAAPAVLLLVREREPGRRTAPPLAGSARGAFTSTGYWLLLTMVFVGAAGSSGALVHFIPLLADHGVQAAQAALALSALGAATFVGRLATGALLDRYPAPRLACLLLVVAAGGLALLASAASVGAAIVAALLLGFGVGGELDVAPYLLSRTFGERALSTLYGFIWTAQGLGSAAGPLLLGRAFDLTGGYAAALLPLAGANLLAGLAMLTFRSPSRPAA